MGRDWSTVPAVPWSLDGPRREAKGREDGAGRIVCGSYIINKWLNGDALSRARGVSVRDTRRGGRVSSTRNLARRRRGEVVSSRGGGAVSFRVQARGEVWWRVVVRQSSDRPPGISSDGSCVGEERME